MKHILPFKLFESPSVGEMAKINPFITTGFQFDEELRGYVEISNKKRGINIFDIDYNENIDIIYNHTKEHDIYKKIKERTPFTAISQFNVFLNAVFKLLYPNYFFETYNSIANITDDKNISLYVNNIGGFNSNFTILYNLSKKYDVKEEKFSFEIYIITILKWEADPKTFDIKYTVEYEPIEGNIINIKEEKNNIKNYKPKLIKKQDLNNNKNKL